MSRTAGACWAAVLFMGSHAALAHEPPATADDALSQARDAYGPPPDTEPCTAEQEAASISGEIVVCRRRVPDNEHRLRSSADARKRYAAATMDAGDPRAPDFAGPPCDKRSAGCIGFGWVPPRAIVIDFAALPEAPPGSDADRVAQGLAPTGRDDAALSARVRAEELGLPPAPAPAEPPLNPPGSAAPAAPPADAASPPAAPAPP